MLCIHMCVCISSFLESVFFFLSAFKKAALSFSMKLHLFERTEAGRCLQSQIRRQKIFHPHAAPTPPSAPAAMQAGGLWLATNRNSWNIYRQTFSSMSLLTDLAPFSRFIPKKQVIVVKWYLRSWGESTPCVVLTLKSASCKAKRVIQKLYANSTESAAWCCELESQRCSN